MISIKTNCPSIRTKKHPRDWCGPIQVQPHTTPTLWSNRLISNVCPSKWLHIFNVRITFPLNLIGQFVSNIATNEITDSEARDALHNYVSNKFCYGTKAATRMTIRDMIPSFVFQVIQREAFIMSVFY